MLFFLSGIFSCIGQAAAFIRWQGLYSITDNRLADFTVTECQVLRDSVGTRYVCNPAHVVTNTSYAIAGVLLIVAGAVIAASAQREGHTTLGLVVPLVVGSGVFYTAAALVPYNVGRLGHDVLMLFFALTVWTLMALLAGLGSYRRAAGADPSPLIYGAYIPLTKMMLSVSVLGMLTLMSLGSNGFPGAYERIAFDTITFWLIIIGTGMYSLGGAADQESRRVAEMEAQWGVGPGVKASPGATGSTELTEPTESTESTESTGSTGSTAEEK